MCRQAIENPKMDSEELIKIAMKSTWEIRVKQIEREIRKIAPRYIITNPPVLLNFLSD